MFVRSFPEVMLPEQKCIDTHAQQGRISNESVDCQHPLAGAEYHQGGCRDIENYTQGIK